MDEEERQVVKLKRPIEGPDGPIDQLSFRRGRLEDIKGVSVETVTAEGLMLVAARLCAVPTGILGKLDQDDAREVVVIAMRFLRACLGTGAEQ